MQVKKKYPKALRFSFSVPGIRSNELQRAEEMVGPCPSCLFIHPSCPGKNLLSMTSEPVRRRFTNVLYGLCICQWPGSLLWESLNSRELSFITNHQKGLQLSPGTRDRQTDRQVVRPNKPISSRSTCQVRREPQNYSRLSRSRGTGWRPRLCPTIPSACEVLSARKSRFSLDTYLRCIQMSPGPQAFFLLA